MLKIDFLKIEEFSRLKNISKAVFITAVGVDPVQWQKETDEHKNMEWLLAVAELFDVPKRIFLVNTLRVVLEDLIDRSWENNKSIDKDGILHGNIGDLELTLAESILLYEGSQTGIANCTLQIQDKYEYRGVTGKPNLIRSELIEWLLNPSVSRLLIKSGSLWIIGAEISAASSKLFEPVRQHITAVRSASSLNISNSIIEKDLFFTDCIFNVDVNFDNSSVQSLLFDKCSINGNFTASNLITNGDVRIFPRLKGENSTSQKIDASEDIKHDISGYLILDYANISGIVDFSALRVKKGVLMNYLTSDLVLLDGLECGGDLRLTGGSIKKKCSMNLLLLKGSLEARNLQCQTLECTAASISEPVDFSSLQCENAWFSGSHFFGKDLSLDLACSTVSNVMLDEGFFAKNGIYVFRCKIGAMLDCSNAVLGENNEGFALAAHSSQIEMLKMNDSIFLGAVYLPKVKVNTQLSLESSIFIAPLQESGTRKMKAINGENIVSGKEISFKPVNESAKNRYEVLLNIKKPEELPVDAQEEKTQKYKDDLLRYKRYAKPLEQLRETMPEYFKVLDELTTHKCYNPLSTLIIGETSFENAEINGRIDCAGAIFFNPDALNIEREKKSHFKKIDDWFSATILGRFIAFLYLLPLGLLQILTRLVNWGYRNIVFKPQSDAKRAQKKVKWANFLNVWLTPEPVSWPNALTLSHTRINGDLFLNKGPKGEYAPFCAVGEVDLHSAKIDNFFLSPDIGTDPLARWRIIGLKYDFIYSNDSRYESLEYCNWFFDYTHEDNFRQPYEQLAASYLKMGDDTNARKVLMQTPGRGVGEKILMAILSLIAYISLPSYRALAWLVVLWFCGMMVFKDSEQKKEIIKPNKENEIKFSPGNYSFQLLIPFISAPQKDAFEPSYKSNTRSPLYIPYRPGWLPVWIPRYWHFDWVYVYHSIHSFLGTILISLFLLGIARIIRNP